MIDKILKAARKVATAGYVVRTVSGEHLGPGFDYDEELPLLEIDRQLLDELIRLVSDYFNPGRAPNSLCRKCGAPLLWVTTTSGAKAPLDPVMICGIDADGVSHRIYLNHFSTCPRAGEVRDEKKAAAAELPQDGKSKAAQ